MGRAKLPHDEARRLESTRRSRQKPEVKQKKHLSVNGGWRNAWEKLQRMIRAGPPSLNQCASTIFQLGKSLELPPPNVSMKMRYVANVVPRNVSKHPTVPHLLVKNRIE
ncbi:hypothetical protein CDAR_29411 [Caerostris darwini]|uniref:Uncharacterized protein n=1 Tax=Caerostris darwini TaxID=1538125 RepID=A0AAV4TUW8_9ARAC|nr:hypothetical protein CDAR_29411 [Caerostris darwini]